LEKLFEVKLEEMEGMLESSALAFDTQIQKVIKDAMEAMEKSDVKAMVKDIAASLEAVRSVQNDLAYGVHETPLLPMISRPSNARVSFAINSGCAICVLFAANPPKQGPLAKAWSCLSLTRVFVSLWNACRLS
jgi:hypothetical protein